MDNFFQHFGTDAAWMWAFQIVSFLIGLLIGYLLWGRLVAELKASLAAMTQERDTLQLELNQLKEKYAELEASLKRANEDIEAKTLRIRALENEKGQLYGDLMEARGERDDALKLQEETQVALDACEAAKGDLDGLGIADVNVDVDADGGVDVTTEGLGIADVDMGGDVDMGDGIVNKLQVIEGIGPKLESVLLSGGVTSFAALALSLIHIWRCRRRG